MKLAIIGSGISGLYSAHYLSKQHEVTIFEANAVLGGHTDTHHIDIANQTYPVDTGFIVFNEHNYHYFCQLLGDLGVASQSSDMSFSVTDSVSGLEYNATTLDKLFCQRRNLFRPRFYRMVRDILRFYREAPALLNASDDNLTLGEYLHNNRYSSAFIDDHILPMGCALWSGPSETVKQFPARYFVSFMANHQMLKISDRPEWRTIIGGSSSYVKAFQQQFKGELRLNSPVLAVSRNDAGVIVKTAAQTQQFDRVIFACHSDQALNLLADPSPSETQILGAMTYQQNEVVLHTDARLMPRHPKAWASWNALKINNLKAQCTVTYYMNLLQNLAAPVPLLVTLNCTDRIDPKKILQTRTYHHPVYTKASLAAQQRREEINGKQFTYYTGAYWGWGFHEDGAQSAQEVVDLIRTAS
ncbi:MAG: FAD-dependent oxidoreductase [Methylococcaceae bacterium]|nr:FAD-dependent oxidoreductase [Methylococcaceae bacterium]MDP2394560.1 FAD-dependent oxidoreductase [Methylococcaceae bacterium]MDP3019955.1 FAD-dependent oxidoreductase [Methylococcaceae bacterium]MDP3389260.1 FAD-dependent oxidoreductase [Methylococcaceae bacterium]MDP3932270.1 FAD-dependent oxidoreductase [Methylococcaceae bacterium]